MLFFLLTPALAGEAAAQLIPKSQYLRYIPLDYPRIVRETAANVELQIWGDTNAPAYVDRDPVDGIDDRRGRTLHALARRFAPYLVQNTFAAPLDHSRFMDLGRTMPVYVDTWDLTRVPELVAEERIDIAAVDEAPCPEQVPDPRSLHDDCRLLALLERFDPDGDSHAALDRVARPADGDPFSVLYFDFPGHDEETWKAAYENRHTGALAAPYQSAVMTYVHPFIQTIRSRADGSVSYEFVLQYWFFYPSNDGGTTTRATGSTLRSSSLR